MPYGGDDAIQQSVRVFGAIGTGIALLAVSAHLLRIEEFSQFRRRMSPF
jgi:predicted ribonuclease YlaK